MSFSFSFVLRDRRESGRFLPNSGSLVPNPIRGNGTPKACFVGGLAAIYFLYASGGGGAFEGQGGEIRFSYVCHKYHRINQRATR